MSQEVYEILKERIFSKHFSPRERLRLSEIEKQMNVSRTPLKDALNRLALEGLVEIKPSRGTFVSDPSLEEIAQAFDVRRVLEVYAVELLAQRITESQLQRLRDMIQKLRSLIEIEDWGKIYQEYVALDYQLHRLIMELAGNKPLRKLWEQVNIHVQMARVRYRSAERELDLAQEEHEELLKELNLAQEEHEELLNEHSLSKEEHEELLKEHSLAQAGHEALLKELEARNVSALKQAMSHHLERAKQSLLPDLARNR